MSESNLVTLSVVALAVGVACAAFTLLHILLGHRQPMRVMEWVWPLTALYFGPLALWAYWRIGRAKARPSQAPGMAAMSSPGAAPHPISLRAVLISDAHCGGGCVLGDVVGEVLVAVTGLVIASSMQWTSIIVDFSFAYVFGILFQYFSIQPMRHLPPKTAWLLAVKADTLSIVAFVAGMLGWMLLATPALVGQGLSPASPVYWFMMQLSMVCGFVVALPVNWLLLRTGVKHVMD